MDRGNPVCIAAALMAPALALALSACDSMERASVVLTPSVVQSNEWGVRDPGDRGARDVFESWARDNGYRCRDDMRTVHGRICRATQAPDLRWRPATTGEGFVAVLSWMDSVAVWTITAGPVGGS